MAGPLLHLADWLARTEHLENTCGDPGCKDSHDHAIGPSDFERLAGLADGIAAEIAPAGGVLRCPKCEREQGLGDVAANLRDGWPKCCGLTMTWVTQRQLDEEEANA